MDYIGLKKDIYVYIYISKNNQKGFDKIMAWGGGGVGVKNKRVLGGYFTYLAPHDHFTINCNNFRIYSLYGFKRIPITFHATIEATSS